MDLPLTKYQPIPIKGLNERYIIDCREGYVYDISDGEVKEVPTFKNDKEYLCIRLQYPDGSLLESPIEDLLIMVLYGQTNSGSVFHIKELPCNDKMIVPEIFSYVKIDENIIEINDVTFKRYLNSSVFISERGTAFSINSNQFYRRNYTDKGFIKISFTINGESIREKLHRLMWKTFINPNISSIDDVYEKDECRWNCVLSNLGIKVSSLSSEIVNMIADDIISGIPNMAVAEKYGINIGVIYKLKTGKIYKSELGDKVAVLESMSRKNNKRS